MDGIAVFSGQGHPALAADIARHLGVPLRETCFRRFSNDCQYVQLLESCREKDVFIIQPVCPPVQENLMELLLMLDAARGASAKRRTACLLYTSLWPSGVSSKGCEDSSSSSSIGSSEGAILAR